MERRMIVNATRWQPHGPWPDKSADDGMQQRLDHAGERGLDRSSQRQGRDGDPELARGDVRIQVPHELAGQLCGHVAFRGKLLDARPPRCDERKLRATKKPLRRPAAPPRAGQRRRRAPSRIVPCR
jgi:hypothetical protein